MATINSTMNGITVQVTSATTHGTDLTGRAWVQIPGSGAQVSSITGASGAMLNPERSATDTSPSQGYASDMGSYSAALNETLNLPLDVVPGDILVCADRGVLSVSRDGSFEAQSCVHFVSTPPASDEALPCSIGWPGRTVEAPFALDVDGWYSSRTTYSLPAGDFPPYATLMASLGLYSPTMVHVHNASGTIGYEGFSVNGLGGGDPGNSNYGRYIAEMFEIAMLALLTPAGEHYSESEIKEIARQVAMHGIELGQPQFYGRSQWSDGGHYQWHQAPFIFAMHLAGRETDGDALMSGSPGNWEMYFEWTSARLAKLNAHDDQNDSPGLSLRRTLGSQPGGSTLRIPVEGGSDWGDDNEAKIPPGAVFTNGTLTATVASETSMPNNPTAGTTLDVPLTGTSPFSSGQTVWATVSWAEEGDFDWNLRGFGNRLSRWWGSKGALYRDLQRITGQVTALHAMGLIEPATMGAVVGYMQRAESANEPASNNDYPATSSSGWTAVGGSTYDVVGDFYGTHWTAISAVPQRGESPSTPSISALTINLVSAS